MSSRPKPKVYSLYELLVPMKAPEKINEGNPGTVQVAKAMSAVTNGEFTVRQAGIGICPYMRPQEIGHAITDEVMWGLVKTVQNAATITRHGWC